MNSKHPAPDAQPADLPDDLEENPGIAQSQALFGRRGKEDDPRSIAGENTMEGDVENNAGRAGEVKTDPGRTND